MIVTNVAKYASFDANARIGGFDDLLCGVSEKTRARCARLPRNMYFYVLKKPAWSLPYRSTLSHSGIYGAVGAIKTSNDAINDLF